MKRGRLVFVVKQIRAALVQGRRVEYKNARVADVKVESQMLHVRLAAFHGWYPVEDQTRLMVQVCPPEDAPARPYTE